jgi:hypothetical protein
MDKPVVIFDSGLNRKVEYQPSGWQLKVKERFLDFLEEKLQLESESDSIHVKFMDKPDFIVLGRTLEYMQLKETPDIFDPNNVFIVEREMFIMFKWWLETSAQFEQSKPYRAKIVTPGKNPYDKFFDKFYYTTYFIT